MKQNILPTYKCATNSDVTYTSLGPFNIACIHCQAVHFTEERVLNRINRDFFDDCCLHCRVNIEPSVFSNELACLFFKRYLLAEEFHKRISNLNSCFALASFDVDDDRTINSHGLYSFIAAGQVYIQYIQHKMLRVNLKVHNTYSCTSYIPMTPSPNYLNIHIW